jgi:hypothetical protein
MAGAMADRQRDDLHEPLLNPSSALADQTTVELC